jgi:hypothetical protein
VVFGFLGLLLFAGAAALERLRIGAMPPAQAEPVPVRATAVRI